MEARGREKKNSKKATSKKSGCNTYISKASIQSIFPRILYFPLLSRSWQTVQRMEARVGVVLASWKATILFLLCIITNPHKPVCHLHLCSAFSGKNERGYNNNRSTSQTLPYSLSLAFIATTRKSFPHPRNMLRNVPQCSAYKHSLLPALSQLSHMSMHV